MTLQAAICDLNPADRKQLERLIDKEIEIRAKRENGLCYESFGSTEALLSSPQKFDLFIIDVTDPAVAKTAAANIEIAKKLRDMGCLAPISLCFDPEIVFPALNGLEDIKLFQKYLTNDKLSGIIDAAFEYKKSQPEKIELRGNEGTFYVTDDEIMYAVIDDIGINVTFTEDRHLHILESMTNFAATFAEKRNFVVSGKNTLLNMDHIAGIMGNGITDRAFRLSDGSSFPINVVEFFRIWKLWSEHRARKNRW